MPVPALAEQPVRMGGTRQRMRNADSEAERHRLPSRASLWRSAALRGLCAQPGRVVPRELLVQRLRSASFPAAAERGTRRCWVRTLTAALAELVLRAGSGQAAAARSAAGEAGTASFRHTEHGGRVSRDPPLFKERGPRLRPLGPDPPPPP